MPSSSSPIPSRRRASRRPSPRRRPGAGAARVALTAVAAVLAAGLLAAPASAQGGPTGASSWGTARTEAEATSGAAGTRLGEAPRARPFAGMAAAVGALRDSIVSVAREHLGIPYRYGGTSTTRGLDCSALVQRILGALGIDLPRTAHLQARTGRSIPRDRALLQPGDVLTFGSARRITHIGLYVGDGKFIHASTSRREVIESSIDNRASSLVRKWHGVRRFVDSTFIDSLVTARPDSLAPLVEALELALPAELDSAARLPRD